MTSEEPPPQTDADSNLTVPSPPDPQPVATTADVPVPPTDPRIHANPPQSDTPTDTAPSQTPPAAAEASSIILSPIPKKSSVSSDQIDASSETRSNSFDGTPSLNLPEGVVLPETVTPELINKVTGSLKIAFFQLSASQMNELLTEYDEAIKTKGSEIRSHEAYFFGVLKRYRNLHQRSLSDRAVVPQGEKLTERVLARLDLLVQSGYCTAEELDMKVKTKLKMLPESDALNAIDEINAVPRGEIRSFGSYFMGILNRYMRGERQNQQRGGGNKMMQNQRFGQMPNMMYGQHHGAGPVDPRFSHYGRSGSSSHYGRDDRDKRSRRRDDDDRKSSRYGRSDDRDRRHRRRRSRSRSYSSSRSRSTSSEYRRRRSRSRSRDRSRRHRDRDSRRSSSHRDSNRHANASYGMGAVPGMHPPPPPPPPPRRPNMPMQMGQQMQGLLPGQMMPGGMQQPVQPQQMGMGQQGQYYQQPQMAQQQPMYSNNNNVSQQVQSVNNAALGQALMPQGIMGIQARGSQVNRPPQKQGQVPLDILALADKASQALSGVQPPAPAPMANPNFPPPPMQSFQQKNFASEQDLSTLVQYALQNLRTTGHVEQQLDGKICSMLKRLPEHAALQALETFSSCDVSKMRSKGGYLAGILKKELVKLGL